MSQDQDTDLFPRISPQEQEREVGVGSSEASPEPSGSVDREAPAHAQQPRTGGANRVRFSHGGEALDVNQKISYFNLRGSSSSREEESRRATAQLVQGTPPRSRRNSGTTYPHEIPRIPRIPPPTIRTDLTDGSADIADNPLRLPRSPILRSRPCGSDDDTEEIRDDDIVEEKDARQADAYARAAHLSMQVGSGSAPGSRAETPGQSRDSSPASRFQMGAEDIPMRDLGYYHQYDTDGDEEGLTASHNRFSIYEARRLLKAMAKKANDIFLRTPAQPSELRSGQVTPELDRDYNCYVPPPKYQRRGVLPSVLQSYNTSSSGILTRELNNLRQGSSSTINSVASTPGGSAEESSGRRKLRDKHDRWYQTSPAQSSTSLAGLIDSSSRLAAPGAAAPVLGRKIKQKSIILRPKIPAWAKSIQKKLSDFWHKFIPPRVTTQRPAIGDPTDVEDFKSRITYLKELCEALMIYGAPTHRLEEYMRMSARALRMPNELLYLPGCMIMSFEGTDAYATEVKIVRASQGVDLGKLRDTHEVYKQVAHYRLRDFKKATEALKDIRARKPKFHRWVLVFVYGLASAFVGPFAFRARLLDIPIAFLLGSVLGYLRLILTPRSELYANVFEVSVSVLTSFLARVFGSLRGDYFCFPALVQSSIALILPGYTVLCASLELQSRNMIAGSIRMVYAIIYSLFLGYGITVGTALYGIFDSHPTSETSCASELNPYWAFAFVPPFTLCLVIINQGKWRQAPLMVIIAFIGYVANFFFTRIFRGNAQIANTAAAFFIGLCANLYSRIAHGIAAAILLPAIFVLVPSGLAASGSLISGVASANQMMGNDTGLTTVSNASVSTGQDVNTAVFNVGYSMIQVAIGITIGLFMASLLIWPFGKKKSALFSF